MQEEGSIDQELRDAVLIPLARKLEAAAYYPHLLNLPVFSTYCQTDVGRIEVSIREANTKITLTYPITPSPQVYVKLSFDNVINKRIKRIDCYLLHDGLFVSGGRPDGWLGEFVMIDNLFNVILVCGLGTVNKTRGTHAQVCDKCKHQFSCLAINDPLGLKRFK